MEEVCRWIIPDRRVQSVSLVHCCQWYAAHTQLMCECVTCVYNTYVICTYTHTYVQPYTTQGMHTHTPLDSPPPPSPHLASQMERERQRRREARLAAEVQENGREDLGRIEGLKKTSGAGEFDDLISALRSGDVFGVGDLSRSRPGRGGGGKGKSAPKRRGNEGREREASRTALL